MSVNRRLLLGLGLAAGLTVPSAAMAQDSIKIGVLAKKIEANTMVATMVTA